MEKLTWQGIEIIMDDERQDHLPIFFNKEITDQMKIKPNMNLIDFLGEAFEVMENKKAGSPL